MRTVPALLVFLLLFGFTACGRKLQNDTDIGNTAAVSSEDRPDKGKLSGGQRSGRPGRSDRSDKSGNVGTISEERDAGDTKGTKGTALAAGIYGGICAAGSHSCSIPWLSGGGGYHFSDTMDEKQRAGAGEGDAFYPDNSTGAHSGF